MRSAYIEHTRIQLDQTGETSRTKQSFQEESQIANIVKRYLTGQTVEYVQAHGPEYGELPPYEDFAMAMNVVAEARSLFEELPSHLRTRFENDPAQFLEFMDDREANQAEMITLGLLPPEVSGELDPSLPPVPVPEIPETPPVPPVAAE